MVERLPSTLWRLFETSSPWRQSVIVGVVGALLLLLPLHPQFTDLKDHRDEGEPCRPGQYGCRTPLPLELGNYRTAYQKIEDAKTIGTSARCERIVAAYAIVPDSLKASTDDRVKDELVEGRSCQTLLATSDRHFKAFSETVARAETNINRPSIDAVVTGFRALDEFDQSRRDYSAARTQADKLAALIDSTDKDFSVLQEAFNKAKTNMAPTAQSDLQNALGVISATDEQLEQDKQKALLAAARTMNAQYAAEQLKGAVKELQAERSPANYRNVDKLYRTVEKSGNAALSDTGIFTAAREAEAELAESDKRLATLALAGKAWQKERGPASCSKARSAMEAVRNAPLDLARMTEQEQQESEQNAKGAFDQFTVDELILNGAERAKSNTPRKAIPVYLDLKSERETYKQAVEQALTAAGLNIVQTKSDAAYIMSIDIGTTQSRLIKISDVNMRRYELKLKVSGRWICSVSPEPEFTVSGDSGDTEQENEAVQVAGKHLVERLANEW